MSGLKLSFLRNLNGFLSSLFPVLFSLNSGLFPSCESSRTTTDITARLSFRESQYRRLHGADCGGTEIRTSADLSSKILACERVKGLRAVWQNDCTAREKNDCRPHREAKGSPVRGVGDCILAALEVCTSTWNGSANGAEG